MASGSEKKKGGSSTKGTTKAKTRRKKTSTYDPKQYEDVPY